MNRPGSARWAVAVLAVGAFLLISMGGAIVAAPATLPLLFVALRRQALAGWLRGAAIAVSGLTVVEVAWAVTYVAAGEAKPWIGCCRWPPGSPPPPLSRWPGRPRPGRPKGC